MPRDKKNNHNNRTNKETEGDKKSTAKVPSSGITSKQSVDSSSTTIRILYPSDLPKKITTNIFEWKEDQILLAKTFKTPGLENVITEGKVKWPSPPNPKKYFSYSFFLRLNE